MGLTNTNSETGVVSTNLLAELQECKKRYEKCFERIALAYGIDSPWILVGMAKNNDENYAEILARFVEEQQAKANSVIRPNPVGAEVDVSWG